MMFLDFLSSYISGLAADRRAASAAQQVQQPAQAFAAAWNRGQLRLPADYLYTVEDPVTGATATAAPHCDAAVDSDGQLRLALTVPPDAPIDAESMSTHAEEVRMLARDWCQVRLRLTDIRSFRQTLQLALAPVRPQVDASGVILVGYDDTDTPVALSLIGEITAISGCDAWCLPWVAASYAAIDQQKLDWQTAIASTRAAIRQAHTGVTQPAMLIDVGDAPCPEKERPERIKDLRDSRRGIVMHSRGDVPADGWAIRPTQILRREDGFYTLERDGRQLRFLPAWLH